MSHVGAPSASESVCSEISIAARTHATIGRSGLKRIARMPPDDGADAARGQDRGPGAGAPEPLVRDRRAEHDPAGEREVADPEEDHRRPEPRPRGELLPALPQLGEEPGRRRLCTRRNLNATEDVRADEEAHGVERQCGPGAAEDDHDASDCGAEDAYEISGHPLERVRLLEPVRRDRLRDEPDLRRDHEAQAEAVDRLEDHDCLDPARAREDAGGGCRLGNALDEGGPHEHEVARQTVGEDAAADHDEGLDALTDGEHDSERGRRRDVEHCERERDTGDPVAGGGDRRGAEEQPEVALAERAEAFAKRRGHGR